MAFKDLREYLNELEAKAELQRIKAEVDWDEEIGAIAQEALARQAPALLFEDIKDYKNTPGRRVSMLYDSSMRRVRIALGLPEDCPRTEMIKIWRERSKNLIKPMLLSTSPCKEVIKKGNEVNLFDFPTPKLHPKDGGRYILTCHLVITKDPETGWVNVGTYRGMMLDKNSIGMLYTVTQHWGQHGTKYRDMGKPMPIAVAIGVEPVTWMISISSCPEGVNEYDMIGAIRQEPLELVKCETIDMEVPAAAEIVLEGEMSFDPKDFRLEGPFGEYPGHYTALGAEPRPVFKVNCVTYRQNPILTSAIPGVSPSVSPELPGNQGDHASMGVANSAFTWDYLENVGVRGITGIASFGPAGGFTVVSINKQYYGHAQQVAAALWASSRAGSSKYVVVVDSDIDATDLNKVVLALCNRTAGGDSVIIYPGSFGGALDPAVHPDVKRKLGGLSRWDRVLIDATWPYEWEAREEWGWLKHPPACRTSEEMIGKVKNRWKEYGFKG